MIYCVVPRQLAPKLHEPLRKHFLEDAGVEVVVERRGADRRERQERRVAEHEAPGERRRIRNAGGRRVADRRAPAVEVVPPALPRRARSHLAELRFVERAVPTGEQAEDVDTARLVTRIQGGDQAGFGDLYLRYFDRVYSYLRILVRDRHEAEDLTQQTFVNVLEALPRYERRKQPFRAWLFTVARRLALDHFKRDNRLEVTEPHEAVRRGDVPVEDSLDEQLLEWIADRDLLLFVERLPPTQQQILVMRFMLDLTTTDIAGILGVSVDVVRQQQSRAIRVLRQRLAAVGRTPHRVERRLPMRTGIRKAPVIRERRFALHR